jgi:hypothetical protein
MVFKYVAIDPSSGYERWYDTETGSYQLRAPATRTTQETQSIPAATTTSAATTPIFTEDQINRSELVNPISSTDTVNTVGAGTVGTTTARANQSGGASSSNDDQIKPGTTSTSATINAANNGPIVPQPNVLDQYASYTYSLSWYILTREQYNELASGQINTNKWMLLMQSGGAQANVNDNGKGGRSPYFTLDYYMDNLVLETNLPGGGSGGTLNANNGGKMEFTVTEPNGLTLPNNLALAYQDAVKNATGGEKEAWAQALYCMVIKFYGYDDAGNLMQAGRNGNQNGTESAASPRANVQKIYPFAITAFDFRLTNRAVEYKIQATCPIFTLNASSRRGSIPQPFALVGKTVSDILLGNGSTGTQVSRADDGRVPTPTTAQPARQAPAPATSVNDIRTSAGVDANGNFTGETASPFAVAGA